MVHYCVYCIYVFYIIRTRSLLLFRTHSAALVHVQFRGPNVHFTVVGEIDFETEKTITYKRGRRAAGIGFAFTISFDLNSLYGQRVCERGSAVHHAFTKSVRQLFCFFFFF